MKRLAGAALVCVLMLGCAHAKRELEATCACDAGEMTTRCEVGGNGTETEVRP